MLTLFRRIRKGLLDGGATRKYILYAVGEIALVVIGILIALQINNWNEWRKDRIMEKDVMEELKITLESNVTTLQGYVSRLENTNNSGKILLSHIELSLPYSDSLNRHFNRSRFQYTYTFVSKSGYEELKNAGLDIIVSDRVKQEVISLFENTYSQMEQSINLFKPHDNNLRKYSDSQFTWAKRNALIPVDYDGVMNDHYYKSLLLRLGYERNWFIELYSHALDHTQNVLQLIKDELSESE